MKQLAIAATATLAIVTVAGLTGTTAARAQIGKAVQTVEHPATALRLDPSVAAQICATRPGALDVIVDANGRPVYAPNAVYAQTCR